MKKLLFITLIISGFKITTQEKQNDASKVECISFIKENIHLLNCGRNIAKGSGKQQFNVNDENVLECRGDYKCSGWCQLEYQVSLNDVSSADILDNSIVGTPFKDDTFLKITSFGNGIKENMAGNTFYKKYWVFNITGREEIGKRVLSALKQLAYWNKIEKSKSKF